MMVDKGPLLTSAIIFYLSIGAAIFQVIEEPNWELAVRIFREEKEKILKEYPCLTKTDLDNILEVVSNAAGQGITITGERTFNNWNWPNAVIFAATVITTIGYGNISPKTPTGRVFCIFYGLFGVPLCFTWISELGKFFGGRAKHFGQHLIKKGVTLRKTQLTCTALFLLWGVLVHLLIPPLVFMSQEGWTYIDGLYFSFVTLTTIGFGDLVAGVDPNAEYHSLYRYFVEVWIYLGLAWLSLFFNWKVRMVVEAHKAIKKHRKRRKLSLEELQRIKDEPKTLHSSSAPSDANIFSFLSKKKEGYSDLIKQIGAEKEPGPRSRMTNGTSKSPKRSKSCNDSPSINGNSILNLEHSPRLKQRYSLSDRITLAISKSTVFSQEEYLIMNERHTESETNMEFMGMCENQLDKEESESQKTLEHGRCSDGSLSWDTFQTFPNANITFIDEDKCLNNNPKDDHFFSPVFPTLRITKGHDSASETSIFTAGGSEHGRSYEQLVEEYSKEENTDI
ncbi:hypothetical protein DNTS_015170 [Danionella cerebrum]|uniref:Potassium channel domain-containing protein n=1 Tax=Danionella cerebrum TaxID=2873325 RepID=A0A553RQ99_9TELE|nr:hypothetical protein DNTS_015170 [Danionella translucida]